MAADKIRPARSLMESRKDLLRKQDVAQQRIIPETVEDEDDEEAQTNPDAQPIPSLLREKPGKKESKSDHRKWDKGLAAKHAQSKSDRRHQSGGLSVATIISVQRICPYSGSVSQNPYPYSDPVKWIKFGQCRFFWPNDRGEAS